MTVQEFSLEFDILYNNISSNAAPGIDMYEKSVYLSKAQLEIIKEYNDLANKYQKGFEGSEKRRVDFKELIKDYKTNTSVVNDNDRITKKYYSKFFTLPSDLFLIKYESCSWLDGTCTRTLDVIPTTLDEFNQKLLNPFKRPDNFDAFRLDFNNNSVEIVSKYDITDYHIRYIKQPLPIILVDLATDPLFMGMNLTIDGSTAPSTCLLNKEIHPEILDRAVELAIRDYRENSLQNKVQLNNRNN